MYRFFLLTTIGFVYYAVVHCQEHNGEIMFGSISAVIMSGPEHHVVALHDKISFHCLAQGQYVFWLIDKRCPCNETEQAYFEERGFHFTNSMTELGEHNNTITVEATFESNGTLISCTALGGSSGQLVHAFQEGSLIIAGPPLAPSVDLNVQHLNNDTFIFTLNWSTPFTWSGFPIINYKIIMTNYSKEQPTTTVNVTKDNNHEIEYTGRGSGCYMLTFSIEANNSLGKGESTPIHSGQPIAIDDIGDIEITFTVLSNGAQQIWMSFLAPRICAGHQRGTYNITISSDNGVIVDHYGPTMYTQENNSERILVVKGLRSDLMLGSLYKVEVTVESLGIFRSQRKNFTTVHNFTGDVVYPRTVTSHLPCLVSQDNKQVITIGSSIGAVFLVFTFILIIVILMVVCCRVKKRQEFDETDSDPLPRRRRARVPSHKMEANPIYEGVVYETTPGESFKPLLNNPSKVETDHNPQFTKACASSLPSTTEDEVRYSGVQLLNETKPVAAIGSDGNIQTLIYTCKRSSDNHMTKNPDDSSSVANGRVPYDDFEEEIYATLR